MIHRAGAGPAPIPHKQLNAQNLREAIQFALSPGAKRAAAKLGEGIKDEVPFLYFILGVKWLTCSGDRTGYKGGWSRFIDICPC